MRRESVVLEPHEGHGVPRGRTAPREEKASEGKPHERDWDETSPGDCEGSKAPKG